MVAALNSVQPYDWAKFLKERLEGFGPAPLDGIKRSGYRLVYDEKPSDYYKGIETAGHTLGLTYSLGMTIGREARLTDVLWEGPAYKLGLTSGTQIIAVNNIAYSDERIKETITAAKKSREPIELLVKNGDVFRTVRFDYAGGLRYPKLERVPGTPGSVE